MRIEGSNRRLSLHWTSLAEGNANFSIVIVFRYADDLMVGFERRAEAEGIRLCRRGREIGIQYDEEPRRHAYMRREKSRFTITFCSITLAGVASRQVPVRQMPRRDAPVRRSQSWP